MAVVTVVVAAVTAAVVAVAVAAAVAVTEVVVAMAVAAVTAAAVVATNRGCCKHYPANQGSLLGDPWSFLGHAFTIECVVEPQVVIEICFALWLDRLTICRGEQH